MTRGIRSYIGEEVVSKRTWNTRIGKLTRRQIDQLLMLGIRMSNVCFNLKQSKDTPEAIRAYMADFQEKWDEVQKR